VRIINAERAGKEMFLCKEHKSCVMLTKGRLRDLDPTEHVRLPEVEFRSITSDHGHSHASQHLVTLRTGHFENHSTMVRDCNRGGRCLKWLCMDTCNPCERHQEHNGQKRVREHPHIGLTR